MTGISLVDRGCAPARARRLCRLVGAEAARNVHGAGAIADELEPGGAEGRDVVEPRGLVVTCGNRPIRIDRERAEQGREHRVSGGGRPIVAHRVGSPGCPTRVTS